MSDVFGYAMGLAGGNAAVAEDVVSDTYLDAVRHFASGRGNEVSVAWLKVVARRRYIDRIRREASLRRRVVNLRAEMELQPSDNLGDDSSASDDVYAALSLLSDDQRLVLIMKYFDALSVREIASQIGRTEKATESLLSRARGALRSAMEECGR